MVTWAKVVELEWGCEMSYMEPVAPDDGLNARKERNQG